MRRTFALLGAAALAITGIAGPANASDINTHEPVVFGTVQAGSNGQAFFELVNLDPVNPFPLEGSSVVGCVGTTSVDPILLITYGPGDIIPSGGGYQTPAPGLNSDDYDLRLVFDFGGPNEHVQDITTNGSPNATCVASLPI